MSLRFTIRDLLPDSLHSEISELIFRDDSQHTD